MLGPDVPLLAHRVGIQAQVVLAARLGRHHQYPVVHHLQHVLVTGDQDHLVPGRGPARGQGGHHVVGLHSRHLDHRQPDRLGQRLDRLDLRQQVGGHGLAGRLVVGEALVAERRTGPVPGQRPVVGRFVAAQHDQHLVSIGGRRRSIHSRYVNRSVQVNFKDLLHARVVARQIVAAFAPPTVTLVHQEFMVVEGKYFAHAAAGSELVCILVSNVAGCNINDHDSQQFGCVSSLVGILYQGSLHDAN